MGDPRASTSSLRRTANFGVPIDDIEYQEPHEASTDAPINAQEEWNLMEALRKSRGPPRNRCGQNSNRNSNHNRDYYDDDDDDEQEDVPKEKWDRLEMQLKQLSVYLKQKRSKNPEEIDPVRRYIQQVEAPGAIKTFSRSDHGFRILKNSRTEAEQLLIEQSNFEMLKFVYSKHPEVMSANRASLDWSVTEVQILESVDRFISHHGRTAFRAGAFSVSMNFDNFPPKLTWRGNEGSLTMLRPVVIDGVAVLKATRPFDDDWRPFFGFASEMPAYDELLNLPVKAIFEVIIDFTIRGHKTVVYLPKYYKEYITEGGICKVDDLFAFRELVSHEHIKFLENRDCRNNWNWFYEVGREADKAGAVFVSTTEYRKRKSEMKYEKPSERIITPCFWNTEDRVMVLEPSIRYKEKPEDRHFKVIPAEEVLQFAEPDDERGKLEEQLYLQAQIETICNLCQLYPTKSMHKISIQQLLHLVVRAESEFEMPGMGLETYLSMCERFVPEEAVNRRMNEDNNSNEDFDADFLSL